MCGLKLSDYHFVKNFNERHRQIHTDTDKQTDVQTLQLIDLTSQEAVLLTFFSNSVKEDDNCGLAGSCSIEYGYQGK